MSVPTGVVQREHTASLEMFAPYVAEFVGTLVLVFTTACCQLTADPTWSPVAVAFIVIGLVYSFGPISGGHMNPAVTICLALVSKMSLRRAVLQVLAQCLGGFTAALICTGVFDQYAKTVPVAPYDAWPCFVVEMFFTTLLCFVFASCKYSKRTDPDDDQNQFFAVAIGFVLIAGGSAGSISGASFNPAVSLALNCLSGHVSDGLLYVVWQLLGAFLASVFFYVCRAEEYQELTQVQLQDYRPKLFVRLISEFIGTFYIVFTFTLSVVTGYITPWAAGATLVSLICSLGNVSGAHFNPVVTLAVCLSGRRKIYALHGLCYVALQIQGGCCGGLLAAYIHGTGPRRDHVYLVAPREPYTWSVVAFVEFGFAFLVAYTTLAIDTVSMPRSLTRQSFPHALAIGLTFSAGSFAIFNISGGVLNPAVAFGMGLQSLIQFGANTHPHFVNVLWFSLYQLMAGVLAPVIFLMTHPHEYLTKDV
mmetsp:Transcript_50807/g.135565  ORF Transcript_50807/g.135565 Transcript_50807/m.135565 type:complete len:477 (-) Transcript_50807:94-1524(-)|eukprot:CAMPEP_0194528130 /NCGR_PEP_ID=MMETSP0253-20130528/64464_1 /TAXON_ID=2966 /ORGANISM="Noctiluca scintillans" /LENGTH=476 /DNA_ID=CAMNT_0039373157 /DNA_START=50 /DNA_END=1480 /DNA_ORIENTATION=-